jgi:ABC-2 type transport system permease protein
MDFLLATPVPIRAVFVAKLLQAILPNFALICLIALPVLYGLGASSNFSWLYYPAALILMAALALAAAGLSGLLVMMVVRVIPARRVAEVLGFLGAVFSFLCSQSGQLARFTDIDPNQAAGAWTWLEHSDLRWSPLTWAARGVTGLGEGRWLEGAGLTLLALGLAGGVFAISLVTAERLYYNGWAGMQNKGRKKRQPRAARSAEGGQNLAGRLFGVIPAPVRGMLVKDWLVLRRDLRNLSQLVTPLILGIVYAISLLGGNDRGTPRPGTSVLLTSVMNNVTTYASVGLSLFVGWMLLGRLAGMGFAQEGKSFWLLKTAPVRAGQMMAAKYLVAYLPTLALSVVYLLGIWLIQSAPLSVLIYSLLVVTLCIAGNASINLAFGIAGANMGWEDPRHMQRTATGCLGALATMAYLPICVALFFGPPVLVPLAGWSPLIGQAIGLALGGVFSLVCAVVPLMVVKGHVEKLGEG